MYFNDVDVKGGLNSFALFVLSMISLSYDTTFGNLKITSMFVKNNKIYFIIFWLVMLVFFIIHLRNRYFKSDKRDKDLLLVVSAPILLVAFQSLVYFFTTDISYKGGFFAFERKTLFFILAMLNFIWSFIRGCEELPS